MDLLCSNFTKFVQRKIDEIAHRLPDKNSKISPDSAAVANATIEPKICQGPTMYSDECLFHPNWFTLRRVIAERVNTPKTHLKVNPIFS